MYKKELLKFGRLLIFNKFSVITYLSITYNTYNISIISLSRSANTISTAMEVYGEKLNKIEDRYIPFCKELLVNLEILEKLRDEGIIHYIQKRSRYFWKLEIYKASA